MRNLLGLICTLLLLGVATTNAVRSSASAPASIGLEETAITGSESRVIRRVNYYRDNPPVIVDLDQYPQFSVVGVLERDTKNADGSIDRASGSAVIVSPCYILTNHHVPFENDLAPVQGKPYTMTFRAGKGKDEGGFLGHTEATPVLWGKREKSHVNDWALMRLHNCVGTIPSFGWAQSASATAGDLIEKKSIIAAVGYSYKTERTDMSISIGEIRGGAAAVGLIDYDASENAGESGGAIFVIEHGNMRLAGLICLEGIDPNKPGDVAETWSFERSNSGISAAEILNRDDVRAILDADKAAFGQRNPAAERIHLPFPLLPGRSQTN